MATSPYEIIAGPADVYVAATATAFPAVNAAPNGSWTYLGRTDGGTTVRFSQNIELLRVDNRTGPIKAIRTEEGLEIETNLADLTLENFAKALTTSVSSAAGPPATKSITLYQGSDVTLYALLVRGPSPYGNWNMQFQVPVVASVAEPEVTFTRDDKAVLVVQWNALEDPLAASAPERFGKLVAQSA